MSTSLLKYITFLPGGAGDCEAKAPEKLDVDELADHVEKQKLTDDDEAVTAECATSSEGAKKKKRKKKKKGSDAKKQQTNPPSIPIVELFPDGNYLPGEIMEYVLPQDSRMAKDRFTSEEAKTLDILQTDIYKEARLAAEAHRHTRRYMQEYIKPGMTMINIAETLEGISPEDD